MKIPCKDCLLIPVCRHKQYHLLIENCEPAFKYLRLTDDEIANYSLITTRKCQDQRILNIEELLKPIEWKLKRRRS